VQVLIADSLPADSVQRIEDLGHAVDVQPQLGAQDLIGTNAEVIVVRSTEVVAEVFESNNLKAVVRAGAGTNTIDLDAASAAGVMVCNTPGQNATAVAELTLGLMLAIDRRIAEGVADLKTGVWDKAKYSKAIGLAGRTLGIVGVGSIGKAVAIRAEAFDMELAAFYRPGGPPEKEAFYDAHSIARYDSVEALAEVSDFMTVHVPADPSTIGLIGDAILSHLRPGSVILNMSRSSVVDEPALLRALDEKDMWAGLDVFADEPEAKTGTIDSALARHPRVYGTHHIGASTAQAQSAVADRVVEVIESLDSDQVLHRVV